MMFGLLRRRAACRRARDDEVARLESADAEVIAGLLGEVGEYERTVRIDGLEVCVKVESEATSEDVGEVDLLVSAFTMDFNFLVPVTGLVSRSIEQPWSQESS